MDTSLISKTTFSLFYKFDCVGNGTLSDGVYRIYLQNDATNSSMHVHTGTKMCNINEDSFILWHQRLGHIFLDRIKRLVNDRVLSTLDYTDFETCVDCIKRKQTNKSKKVANRSSNILKSYILIYIIQTWICMVRKYFVTFIGDYSRYMYVYLLHNKHEALDAFKVFKAKLRTNVASK